MLRVLAASGDEPEPARPAAHCGDGEKTDEGGGKAGEQLTRNVTPRQRGGGKAPTPVPDLKIKADIGKMREGDREAGDWILQLKERPQSNRYWPGDEHRDHGAHARPAQHAPVAPGQEILESAECHRRE